MTVLLTNHQKGQCRAVIDYENGELGKAIMCGEATTLKLDGTRSSWCAHHHELYTYGEGRQPSITQARLAELGVTSITKKSKATSPRSPWHGQVVASKPKPPPPLVKRCGACRMVKPVADFHKDGDRYRVNCRTCRNNTASKPKGPQLPEYDESKFIPLAKVASKYGFPSGTVYTWQIRGVLPITKIGPRCFAMIADVEFLAATKATATSSAE
jgi:hypothetical protein